MNSSVRKIDKNKFNNLKNFFENLICSNNGNNLIQRDKNNNNSNESSKTDNNSINPDINDDEASAKNQSFSVDLNKIKFKNENRKPKSFTKKENDNEKIIENQVFESFLNSNIKNSDQISITSLSKCSVISDFLSDKESIDFKRNIQVIYQENSKIPNSTKLEDRKEKPNSFTFNLFKLLKLMLTAKCYCVLLTEKKNSSDLKKLIFILYQMKQTALKKLSNIDSTEIENAKLNEFLLADFFNILCEIHSEVIKLDSRFKKIIISKKKINKEVIDELFSRINLIVFKILSIQKILCVTKPESSEQMWNDFQNEYESQIKVFEDDHFYTLKEFYRKNVMSPDFKKFLKCSYNFECSQQEKGSLFIDDEIFNNVKSLVKEKFYRTASQDLKLPKLSISKDAFLRQYNGILIQKPSKTTITSSNISNLTFQNANSEFEKNFNNNCQKKIADSNNSEASFVAMLKLNNDISKFLIYKNWPRNQFISLSNTQKFELFLK